ncbi:MAG: GGDEF domain-containing protein [Gammaproteobacteria bacterium]|nr:GGDEF domain-containing protein [Gammaproteobacteria bacterium]
MQNSSAIKLISRPIFYYPLILLTAFSVLRFLNLQIEEQLGFRILNPAIMGIIIGYAFGRQIERERELHNVAISDPLSGLYNRMGLNTHISHIFSNNTDKRTVSIISIDIDDFKIINDTYGHDIGDMALSTLGNIIKDNTRATDIAARCGGDEFIIVLPRASYDAAMRVAESIIEQANNTPIKIDNDHDIKLGVSIGLASAEDSTLSRKELFKSSDQQLYKSKHSGKNKICGIQA